MTVVISAAVFIVVGPSVGVPLGIFLKPHDSKFYLSTLCRIKCNLLLSFLDMIERTDPNTTPACRTSCSFSPFVDNPSSNYQGEQLNFTCTQTLTNMTLTMIAQRNYNETHAQQYQTFWNQSTNATYTVTPSQIIYEWFSSFHMYIVSNSFPHFVRVEYYYTPGSTRLTSNDTWTMSATTTCGGSITYSGTF